MTFTVNAPDDTEPDNFAELSARVTVDPLPATFEDDGYEVLDALVEDCEITDSEVTALASATLDDDGMIKCACGNVPEANGFTACSAAGVPDDDLLKADAVGLHYLCERCGLVFGPWPSVAVVGRVPV